MYRFFLDALFRCLSLFRKPTQAECNGQQDDSENQQTDRFRDHTEE